MPNPPVRLAVPDKAPKSHAGGSRPRWRQQRARAQTSSMAAMGAESPRRGCGSAMTRQYPPLRPWYRPGASSNSDFTIASSYTNDSACSGRQQCTSAGEHESGSCPGARWRPWWGYNRGNTLCGTCHSYPKSTTGRHAAHTEEGSTAFLTAVTVHVYDTQVSQRQGQPAQLHPTAPWPTALSTGDMLCMHAHKGQLYQSFCTCLRACSDPSLASWIILSTCFLIAFALVCAHPPPMFAAASASSAALGNSHLRIPTRMQEKQAMAPSSCVFLAQTT